MLMELGTTMEGPVDQVLLVPLGDHQAVVFVYGCLNVSPEEYFDTFLVPFVIWLLPCLKELRHSPELRSVSLLCRNVMAFLF